jgi:hypothetical protein
MMRIFKLKTVAKFTRRERISDLSLIDAIQRAELGIVDADLGSGLIKQRIARPGQGRSGGYRLIVAYRVQERAIFLFGFAKNDRENLSPDQLSELREIGADMLAADTAAINKAIEDGLIKEIKREDEKDA